MLAGVRDRLIRNRTQLSNAIRGYAGEFGFIAAKGKAHLDPLLERVQADESLPALARELFAAQAKEYAQLQAQIDEVDAKLMTWHRADECSRRLAKIPGVGPIGAVLLKMKTPDPELFRSGRQFAAWIGVTPKDHSTAGKVRLGVITRAGDEGLRSVLVVGATAVIQHGRRGGRASRWLSELLKRKSPKLAAVALANKMARIAWKLMVTGENYVARNAGQDGFRDESSKQMSDLIEGHRGMRYFSHRGSIDHTICSRFGRRAEQQVVDHCLILVRRRRPGISK